MAFVFFRLLYGKNTLTIEVVTEAMQCTEDGKEEWNIVRMQRLKTKTSWIVPM